MFFESWQDILKILFTTFVLYFFLLFASYLMRKGTFAKMNNFDWIITFAMGSILGSAIINKDVIIFDVIIALTALLILHYLLSWFSARFVFIDRFIKTSPCMLYYQGEFVSSSMKKHRLSQIEIEAIVRTAGYADMLQVSAVILEPDGNISVIAAGLVNDSLVNKLK